MALKKIIEIEGNAVIQTADGVVSLGNQKTAIDAYCKIESITADKKQGHVVVVCSSDRYKITKNYDVPLSVNDDAPNFIKQAYLALKTLPEWSTAVDC